MFKDPYHEKLSFEITGFEITACNEFTVLWCHENQHSRINQPIQPIAVSSTRSHCTYKERFSLQCFSNEEQQPIRTGLFYIYISLKCTVAKTACLILKNKARLENSHVKIFFLVFWVYRTTQNHTNVIWTLKKKK